MRPLDTRIDWNQHFSTMAKVKREDLLTATANLLWQTANLPDASSLEKHLDGSSRETYIQSSFIRLMGSPEYQLC